MKKVVKLTESDLKDIIERVLNESATINDVKIGRNDKGHLTVGDNVYKITVDCEKMYVTLYSGPISISKIWTSKNGGIAAEDNTGKQFTIEKQKSKELITKMNRGDRVINTSGSGSLMGISGSCKAKLTKD